MKVEIHLGRDWITVEGDLAEIRQVLDEYWLQRSVSDSEEPQESINDSSRRLSSSARPRRKSLKKLQAKKREHDDVSSPKIDPERTANELKNRSDYSIIREKVLTPQSDWINKCKLVAYLAKEPVTSGDVQRVLEILRIKSSLPVLSRTLKNNSGDFLTKAGAGNTVKYTLTSAAEQVFEELIGVTSDA